MLERAGVRERTSAARRGVYRGGVTNRHAAPTTSAAPSRVVARARHDVAPDGTPYAIRSADVRRLSFARAFGGLVSPRRHVLDEVGRYALGSAAGGVGVLLFGVMGSDPTLVACGAVGAVASTYVLARAAAVRRASPDAGLVELARALVGRPPT